MLGNQEEHRHGLCLEWRWRFCVSLGWGGGRLATLRWPVPTARGEGAVQAVGLGETNGVTVSHPSAAGWWSEELCVKG